jgi:hypothetical protein
VYLADGGGGGTSSEPSYSGPQTLNIEPHAIPAALAAFRIAHETVSKKVEPLRGLPIQPWAGDEVSRETATQFAERSTGGGAESAIACLLGYEKQLKAACDSLEDAQRMYIAMEGDNAARWGKYDEPTGQR